MLGGAASLVNYIDVDTTWIPTYLQQKPEGVFRNPISGSAFGLIGHKATLSIPDSTSDNRQQVAISAHIDALQSPDGLETWLPLRARIWGNKAC
ncbi:hypothetical protein TWF594_007955 [Orbilia oligospora]|nr:hypothetical protein TWF706_003898 [Orbilia oligospora]KAF3136319.1 hypothetical protein TWF594_007955 [Orbilia oligospora]